ncbi:MAG: EscU/YscU/HrcU family type III secretion system export apparatus switch protein [Desulfobacula sp.]|nr:EscU/YscU/HrcU family type III secretion system export apparatus switch protein [Desulfobacula sp.]
MDKKYTKKAVALKYDRETASAPKVIAKGKGNVAQKIIELAKKHDIPIKDDPDLIEVLSSLEIDEEIPAEIYVAVAELLAFVYSINSKRYSDPGSAGGIFK